MHSLATDPGVDVRAACSRCVMDSTDPELRLDVHGVCNHCHAYDATMARQVPRGAQAAEALQRLVAQVRAAGAGRPYDCVIGVSGGVDSTYLAHQVVKRFQLRPLAVHLDNGWDTELSVRNIYNLLTRLNIPLETCVLDWESFRDLQVAFLRASTPDSEIPTDHAIFSFMFQTARKHGIRYILSGGNARTESHLPRAWSQGHQDWRYIRSVHRLFGTRPLVNYPHRNWARRELDARTIRWVEPLDLMEFHKGEAARLITSELDWRPYGGKHHESIYTRFYQGCLLPMKFGFDKRRSHLSSLVCSGEMTREAALRVLQEPPYVPALQREDRTYAIKKLGLTEAEFQRIERLPPKRFEDYPSDANDGVVRAAETARAVWRTLRPSHRS